MTDKSINRRDLLLIGSGLAALCVGKFADSSVNGTGAADTAALDTAISRLAGIPVDIGNWTSTDGSLSQREQEVASISGYVRRTYHNPRSGYSVHLTVLCGPSGPIAVHPPTACFEGIGYTLASGPTPTVVKTEDGDQQFQFNKSSFRQSDASVPEIVRVFWGWGLNGEWQAPANPRFKFRGQPYLYKIYITDRHIEDPRQTALPQIEAFAKDALPAIESALAAR